MNGGYLPRLFYFNRAAPGGLTDIIANGITNIVTGSSTLTNLIPTVDSFIAVSVVLATASVFSMTETYSGTTNTYKFEAGAQLVADSLYGWSLIPVFTTATYNFQVTTNGIIKRLAVSELQIGVAS